jgi:hypothetical protein
LLVKWVNDTASGLAATQQSLAKRTPRRHSAGIGTY